MGVMFLLSICFGSLTQSAHAMEQVNSLYSAFSTSGPSVSAPIHSIPIQLLAKKRNFVDPNRSYVEILSEKGKSKLHGMGHYVTQSIESKQPFASSQARLEGKITEGIEDFIQSSNFSGLVKLINLCKANNLPLTQLTIARAIEFIRGQKKEEISLLRMLFEQSLLRIQGFETTLSYLETINREGSSTIPLEKPEQLFSMLYPDLPQNSMENELYPSLKQLSLNTENPLSTDQKPE